MDPVDQNRLKWKCRRGLLELDLILERYLSQHPHDAELLPLLEMPDNHLWDVVAGRSDDYDPRLDPIVARLRATTAAPLQAPPTKD